MEYSKWITRFGTKELFAPFTVEKDGDYYDDLCKKYELLIKQVKKADADEESIRHILRFTGKIKEAIRLYYRGRISTSHTVIKNLIKELCNESLAVDYLPNSRAFLGETDHNIEFFRGRINKSGSNYSAKEMLHLPLNMRGKTGNYRFSIPGIPSLYLGNSSYACWEELGRPAEHDFDVSPVILDGTQRILNLAVMQREIFFVNSIEKVHTWFKLLTLMIATSYTINEEGRNFKSEYIVSQSIMLACNELGLDGVAYYSKRVSDEAFAKVAINLALFVRYQKRRKYSELCQHLKIDDSFNYAMFRQLNGQARNSSYTLRYEKTGVANMIGDYHKQFAYRNTEFYSFDSFLFNSWKDKDSIEWGNAVKEDKA